MKGKPTRPRVVLHNPNVVRSLDEVRLELERRHGIRITRARVWAISRSAELKIAKALGGSRRLTRAAGRSGKRHYV